MRYFLICLALLGSVACHPGQPVLGGDKLPVGGTISGTVSAGAGTTAVPSRKVTVINVATNARFDTTTTATGGYTVKVPEGSYRIELELRPGEALAKQPSDVRIHNGDLDARRDFVVTVANGR